MSVRVDAGFLLVDKPSGWTSHDVVAKVRNLLRMKKVGHAGTLDPMATGLVVVGIGRATRLLRFVQAAPKEYIAKAVFGVATDSLDADGAILERAEMDVTQSEVERVMERFTGTIAQVPPMVSARKVGGRKLYELAREGVEIEREAREENQIDILGGELRSGRVGLEEPEAVDLERAAERVNGERTAMLRRAGGHELDAGFALDERRQVDLVRKRHVHEHAARCPQPGPLGQAPGHCLR